MCFPDEWLRGGGGGAAFPADEGDTTTLPKTLAIGRGKPRRYRAGCLAPTAEDPAKNALDRIRATTHEVGLEGARRRPAWKSRISEPKQKGFVASCAPRRLIAARRGWSLVNRHLALVIGGGQGSGSSCAPMIGRALPVAHNLDRRRYASGPGFEGRETACTSRYRVVCTSCRPQPIVADAAQLHRQAGTPKEAVDGLGIWRLVRRLLQPAGAVLGRSDRPTSSRTISAKPPSPRYASPWSFETRSMTPSANGAVRLLPWEPSRSPRAARCGDARPLVVHRRAASSGLPRSMAA